VSSKVLTAHKPRNDLVHSSCIGRGNAQITKEANGKAKARLDDAREKHKLAVNASELVKHYKALVLAL
jgi:hypothetical protein